MLIIADRRIDRNFRYAGKKDHQEKLFAHFQLSDRIPEHNFYRRLKKVLDLDFLYPLTKGYYREIAVQSAVSYDEKVALQIL